MMTTIQTMTAHGGTPLHCRHREQGVCATPTGRIRAACQREVESGAFVYVWYDADHAIGFPSAAALVAATRANYATNGAARRDEILASL